MRIYHLFQLIVFSSSEAKTYRMFGWMTSMCMIYWVELGFSAEIFLTIVVPIVA
jgi:hypothetical protein